MAALDEKRLEAIVANQIELAKSHDSREREKSRSKALDYFTGTTESMAAYIPPEPNRSKAVSKDVADTIGWMLPGIMRVYTASDRMAMAEPVGEEDVEFAREATDGLNYVFWKDNKGYEIVYNATWDALLFGNGIVKTWYDDTPVYKTSFHSGLDENQLAQLLMPNEKGEEPEVLAQTETLATLKDEMGNEVASVLYEVKIKRKTADGRFIMEAIAPEKFLLHEDTTATDESAFKAHWERKTRSELVQEGYDRAEVARIPAAARNETPEDIARRNDIFDPEAVDASTEMVDYYECFIRIDVDDDGEAELVRACMGGATKGVLLDWEVWEDEDPFDDIPCEPIPHRWSARSIFDETYDIQDIKTVLTRQFLNNLYWVNNPQNAVTGKVENPDALISPDFGDPVFLATGAQITPIPREFIGEKALLGLSHFDNSKEMRTGVSRGTMALDPEALQNQTATASQNQKDSAYSQIELIARNMAEWGWRKVFRKLMRLMVKHQGPRKLMMNGKPVQIDPRFWNADMDVTINVGLGTGSRDRDLMMLKQVLETQLLMADRFMAAGATEDAIDMLPKIIRTMTKMAESAGIRNPEEYYPEYTAEKVEKLKLMAAEAKAKPDPKVQIEQERLKADMQRDQAQMQMDAAKGQQDAQIKQATAQQDIMLQREKMAGEMAIKREQMIGEFQLKREQLSAELTLKSQLAREEMAIKREAGFYKADRMAETKTSGVHMGGDPG